MKYARTAAAAFALLVGAAVPAGAEGTETLGPPSIAIAQGSGVAVAGTGRSHVIYLGTPAETGVGGSRGAAGQGRGQGVGRVTSAGARSR